MSKENCSIYQNFSIRIQQLFCEAQEYGHLCPNDDLDQQHAIRDGKFIHVTAYRELAKECEQHMHECEECKRP